MPDSRHKAIGIAGLIQAGDPTALTELEKNLSQILRDDLDQVVARPLFSSWRNPDLAAAESLGRIATSPSLPAILLRAASTALLRIHTAATLPYLIQLMDSEDRNSQIDAVLGFAGFANGLPIHTVELGTVNYLLPAPTAWRSAETEQHFGLRRDASESDVKSYVQFWKQWWALHKQAIFVHNASWE